MHNHARQKAGHHKQQEPARSLQDIKRLQTGISAPNGESGTQQKKEAQPALKLADKCVQCPKPINGKPYGHVNGGKDAVCSNDCQKAYEKDRKEKAMEAERQFLLKHGEKSTKPNQRKPAMMTARRHSVR